MSRPPGNRGLALPRISSGNSDRLSSGGAGHAQRPDRVMTMFGRSRIYQPSAKPMMIMSIVAPSSWDYRTEPQGAQYEISERHRHATCRSYQYLRWCSVEHSLTNDDHEIKDGYEVRDRSHKYGFRFTHIL
jgi:hypothetical protein